jgi:hypothetical protein
MCCYLSGELLCFTMAGQPPCHSNVAWGKLCGIGNGVWYFNSHQLARDPWAFYRRDESLMPPLFVRKGARHDQPVPPPLPPPSLYPIPHSHTHNSHTPS